MTTFDNTHKTYLLDTPFIIIDKYSDTMISSIIDIDVI